MPKKPFGVVQKLIRKETTKKSNGRRICKNRINGLKFGRKQRKCERNE